MKYDDDYTHPIEAASKKLLSVFSDKIRGREEAFSQVAADCLESFPNFTTSDFFHFLRSSALSGKKIEPHNPRFGQPSIVVARDGNVFVEMLLWRDDITSVHEHSFSGAFKALDGRRLHCVFNFALDATTRLDTRIEFGQLELEAVELLEAGAVRKILSGRQYIHMLWSIDRPVLSVVLRQVGNKTSTSYLPGGLTYHEFPAEEELAPLMLAIETMRAGESSIWLGFLEELARSLSLNALVFLILVLEISPCGTEWLAIRPILDSRCDKFLNKFERVIQYDKALRQVAALRQASINSKERKFIGATYLSLLSNRVGLDAQGFPTQLSPRLA